MEARIQSFILTLLATYGDVDLCIIAKDFQEGDHLRMRHVSYKEKAREDDFRSYVNSHRGLFKGVMVARYQ